MKRNIFKYVAILGTLLATAVNAGAQQYKIENGVGTSKQVTGPAANGDYTIRLETFATGTTTVTETSTPVDVVLVLDVSGSMAEPMSYVERTSQAYSYNSYGDNTYYYLYNGEYCEVERYDRNFSYYLRFEYNNQYYYLRNNNTPTTSRNNAAYSNQTGGTIWTGVLYEVGETKMDALKTAVSSFIDEIQLNDLYVVERDDQGNVTSQTPRDAALGNQISIVKFAMPTYYSNSSGWITGTSTTATTTPGNHFPETMTNAGTRYYRDYNNNYYAATDYTRYNDSEVLQGFTSTASDANVTSLKSSVNNMIAAGATASDYGLNLARLLLAGSDTNPDANKVVVFFTDGSPTYSNNFDNTVANNAITYAKQIKDSGASIFSIGVFDSTPSTNGDIWKYMNYVSSNYPNATNINTPGADGKDAKFYQDASAEDADLTAIFKTIASGIGGASSTVGTSTQVRDVVTNSFVLPDNVESADVKVYTSAATGDATGADDTNVAAWDTPVDITSSVTINIKEVDADGNPTTDATKVKNKALFVEGFEYSKADSSEGAGDGNWVGPRYNDGNWTWAGKKLIITFKVTADPEATGGESLTNTGTSGVYIMNEDSTYTCVTRYDQPHTTLSVNIKIRKTGLRHGESATFELMRIRPKGYDSTGVTTADKIANIEYNLIGKPVPGTHEYNGTSTQPDMSDYYEGMGWDGFKKVILTNKGDDGAEVVKVILALDPYWVYLVLEDDWGWAYTMTGDQNQVGEDGTYTTSSVEVNPFRFHNTEELNAVKHAEAIMINHFKSDLSDADTEHYKSSKVESF